MVKLERTAVSLSLRWTLLEFTGSSLLLSPPRDYIANAALYAITIGALMPVLALRSIIRGEMPQYSPEINVESVCPRCSVVWDRDIIAYGHGTPRSNFKQSALVGRNNIYQLISWCLSVFFFNLAETMK